MPGSALGLAAVLGLLGLAGVRSGSIAPGLAALYGSGGFRSATQSLFTFAWSGRCVPLGAGSSLSSDTSLTSAAFASAPGVGADGGRGAVKGVIDARPPDDIRGGGSLPATLATVVRPPGGGGPTAVIVGLLLAVSAAFGALLGRFTGGGREPVADPADDYA